MLQLSGRALTASSLDGELFVDRERELGVIERATRMRFNVYVAGDAGIGKTSLLRRVQARSEQPMAFVSAASVDHYDALLSTLAEAAAVPGAGEERRDYGHPLGPLRTAVDGSRHVAGPTIIVDDLDPGLRHQLFGRQRDELWELPIRWILTGGDRLRPPGDAFFETQLQLEAMGTGDLREVLARRAKAGADPERARLLELSDELPRLLAPATPRRLLAAARAVMVSTDPAGTLADLREQRDARVHLSEPQTRVLEALDALGPTHAGDERLLSETGTTRSRVVQLLRDLEDEGLVTSARDGRRKLYAATEPDFVITDPTTGEVTRVEVKASR